MVHQGLQLHQVLQEQTAQVVRMAHQELLVQVGHLLRMEALVHQEALERQEHLEQVVRMV